MKKFIQLTFCLLWAGVMSCQQNAFDKDVFGVSKTLENRDYLEFENEKEFSEMLDVLSRKSHAELDVWEQQQRFVSLRKRYNEVVKAEEVNGDKGLKPFLSQEAKLYSSVYIPSEYGGIEPNVADWRMMAVVNVDGIVKIGGFFHQFGNKETKSILDKPDQNNEITTLKMATQSDAKTGLTVAAVRTTHQLVTDTDVAKGGRLAGTIVQYSRSCENASGDPQQWRMIAYEELLEIERGGQEYVCSTTYKFNTTTNQVETSVTCAWVNSPSLRQYQAQLHIRTLKRGFWGNWYDRSSSEQQANGVWKLASSSVVAPGWNSGNTGNVSNPFADNSYNATNTTGETSTLNFIFWTSTLSSSGNSNIRLDGSSQHTAIWNSYNCECNI